MSVKRILFLVAATTSAACATTPDAPPRVRHRVHLGAAWFNLRAGHLGMSVAEARERDALLGPSVPPDGEFWDASLAKETAVIWSALCEDCHGGRRTVEDAQKIAAPAPGWGAGDTAVFGRTRPFVELYNQIHDGGEDKNEMPAWGDKLANEQVWSLVYYVERLSADATTNVHLENKKKK